MFKRSANGKKTKKKRQIPMIAAVVIMVLVFVLFVGNLLIVSLFVNSVKYTSEAAGNVRMLEYAVADTDRNSEEILSAYNETTMNRVQFAGLLYEKGLFETDPGQVRAVLEDENEYYLLDSNGKPLEGQKELPVSDADMKLLFRL